MATRRAVANGNWSATSTWNGGVVPTNGDTVYANGFNVTLDTDVLIGRENNPTVSAGSFVSGQWYEINFVGTTLWTGIGAASNTTGTVFLATGVGSGTGTAKAIATLTTVANTPAGAAAGGSFVMSTVRAINTDLRAGTTTCLNVTATSGTLTLSQIRAVGGSGAGSFTISNTSAASLNIQNCTFTGGTGGGAPYLINNASSGSISATGSTFTASGGGIANNASTGSILFQTGTLSATGTNAFALNNASTGTITVENSTLTAGAQASCFVLNNNSTGTCTITNCSVTAGQSATSQAVNNVSTGSIVATGSTFTASAFANAVNIANTSADVRLSGDFLDHWSGWKAVSGGKWRLGTAPTLGQTRYALAGTTDSYFTMYGADNGSFGNPIAANVRSGIVYGGGNITGSCAVPAAGSVALGVPVDAGFGTAALTPAAVWEYATRTITGGTVNVLTTAPSVPTAAAIAAEVWAKPTTELTITGSIGERAKNQSTVSTTGAQLAAALS